jgi:hypothetical protein
MLEALDSLPDEAIDCSDIPSLPEEAWKNAVRGKSRTETFREKKP